MESNKVKINTVRAFTLHTDDGKTHEIKKGVSEIDASLADHWYVKGNLVAEAETLIPVPVREEENVPLETPQKKDDDAPKPEPVPEQPKSFIEAQQIRSKGHSAK